MKTMITCTCGAAFEIKGGTIHPKKIICPNCGSPLPSGASDDLLAAMASIDIFESKLEVDGDRYEVSYSKE